jgi:hypothetical protein
MYITGAMGITGLHKPKYCTYTKHTHVYIHSAPVSTGNTFQDLPRLCETADNTERYVQRDIRVKYINAVKSDKLRTVRHYQH